MNVRATGTCTWSFYPVYRVASDGRSAVPKTRRDNQTRSLILSAAEPSAKRRHERSRQPAFARFFPKELPPPFKTVSLGLSVSSSTAPFAQLAKGIPAARLAHHNLARPGNIYRRLGLPNPAKHYPLCAFIAQHWDEFERALAKSALSLSIPTPSAVGRALNPSVAIGALAEHRIRIRAGDNATWFKRTSQGSILRSTPTEYRGLFTRRL